MIDTPDIKRELQKSQKLTIISDMHIKNIDLIMHHVLKLRPSKQVTQHNLLRQGNLRI